MKKEIHVIFLATLICLTACDNEKVDELAFIDPEAYSYSELVKTEKVIPLETSEESLVGVIDKIQLFDNKIFILDIFNLKKLLVFALDGSFLGCVGSTGRGPGEYLVPISFSINERDNTITIYDNSRAKALRYHINNFEYIDEIDMSFHFTKCLWMDDSSLSFYIPGTMTSSFEGHILVSNDSLELINEYSPASKETKQGYSDVNYIYKFGEENRYILPNEGIIYSFDRDRSEKRCKLILHKPFPPSNFFMEEKEPASTFYERIRNSNYVSWYEVLESKQFLIVKYIYDKKYYLGIHDKISDKTILTSTNELNNTFTDSSISLPVATYDDFFVSVATDPQTTTENPLIVLYKFSINDM